MDYKIKVDTAINKVQIHKRKYSGNSRLIDADQEQEEKLVHVDPVEAMDGGVGQEDAEATPACVDPEQAMDGGVVQEDEDGEATPASPIDAGDLVTLKSASEHGDRGIVVYMDDDTPEDDKLPVMYVGGAVVHLDRGNLAVVDRSSMRPGQLVVSASDPGGQVGVVVAVDTTLDLVPFDGGAVITTGVSPGELRRVTDLALGDYVASGPWLGRVVELSVEVDVLFDDGAACRVTAPETKLGFEGMLRTANNGLYYPGQRVAGAVFHTARWLHGQWKRDGHVEGTVARVELASVVVSWVAARHLGAKLDVVQASEETPPHQQNPRDLTFVRSDREGYWGVADRCFFRDPGRRHELPRDTSTTAGDVDDAPSDQPQRKLAAAGELEATTPQLGRKTFFRRDERRSSRWRVWRHAVFERPMSVADSRTTADVLWQDGTRRRGIPSASLAPFETHVGELVPGERVTGVVHDDGGARLGVVRSVDYKDRTARVAWLRPAASGGGEEPSEVEREETVSAYDLETDHDRVAFYGDVVMRRPPSESGGGDIGGTSTAAAGEDLSWVGHVVDLCDAYIQVKWADGNTSKVLPHEIEIVEELDVYTVRDAMGEGDWMEDGDDAADEEAEEDDDKKEEPAAAAAVQHQRDGSAGEIAGGEDSAETAKTTWRLGALIHALIRLPGEVLARGKRYLVGGTTTTTAAVAPSSVREAEAAMEMNAEPSTGDGHDDDEEEEEEVVDAPASCGGEGVDGDGSDENGNAAAGGVASGDEDDSSHFTQFDVVQQCPSDHHFLDDVEQGASGGNKWAKRVQKEWKILQNNLPDTIYVRAYEDRMDLLRAAMVGAAGTPYQDGLFFFDVQLPASYPSSPPQVYYHSFGLRVNPNLDVSGTVCLSLLDTYDDGGEGGDSTRWSPASSTVLQVLVSIQGLVLTAQPYYNESSYEFQLGTPGGSRNALPYAEHACLQALRTATHLLRRSPAGFEDLVAGHFRRRGRLVLRACEAYLKGCAVGTLDAEACATPASGERPCSPGMRIALAAVVPRLAEAFAGIGADGCEQFEPLPSADLLASMQTH